MWQPSIAHMTPSRPHVRWKMVVDTLFSQHVGQETEPIKGWTWWSALRVWHGVLMKERRWTPGSCSGLSCTTGTWAPSWQAAIGCGHFPGHTPLGTFEGPQTGFLVFGNAGKMCRYPCPENPMLGRGDLGKLWLIDNVKDNNSYQQPCSVLCFYCIHHRATNLFITKIIYK